MSDIINIDIDNYVNNFIISNNNIITHTEKVNNTWEESTCNDDGDEYEDTTYLNCKIDIKFCFMKESWDNIEDNNRLQFTDNTNTIRFYVNGTASTTTANDPNNYLPSTNGLRIGSTYSQGLNGKISNFRVINGTALYTGSSFVVPSLPLTDVTNTVLLMKSVTNATVVSDSSTYAKSITNTSVTWTDGPIVYP
jgi:hypothetical protein